MNAVAAKTQTPQLKLRSRSMVVIPARLASTRLPRKLLLSETGKSVIQHTYESATKAESPCEFVIAADHEEIASTVAKFEGNCVMTDPNAASGTDRVAEVARANENIDIFVNVQGDEPEIRGSAIDLAVQLLEENPDVNMATLATPIRNDTLLEDPNCVKVVFNNDGNAMYFSRSPIPFARDWRDEMLSSNPPTFYQHVGLYAYRREFLLNLAQIPQCHLERTEKLEQLRVLSAGHTIKVGVIDEPTTGIDTLDDYRAFVRRMFGR